MKINEVGVKRAGKCTSLDIRNALFESPPEPKPVEEMDEGLRAFFNETTPDALLSSDA